MVTCCYTVTGGMDHMAGDLQVAILFVLAGLGFAALLRIARLMGWL